MFGSTHSINVHITRLHTSSCEYAYAAKKSPALAQHPKVALLFPDHSFAI